MTFIKRLRFLVLALLALVFAACKYDLVKETTFDYSEKKNAADYDDFILPPQNVTASQGQSKSVTLEWIGVKNAVQYQIYSAPTPYDTFTKISMQNELKRIQKTSGTTMLMVTHDIDEAVLLGDRVYVMSRRPGCVRDVLDVEIPGERSHNSLVLPEFLKVKKQIMDMLWQESNDAAMDR